MVRGKSCDAEHRNVILHRAISLQLVSQLRCDTSRLKNMCSLYNPDHQAYHISKTHKNNLEAASYEQFNLC